MFAAVDQLPVPQSPDCSRRVGSVSGIVVGIWITGLLRPIVVGSIGVNP